MKSQIRLGSAEQEAKRRRRSRIRRKRTFEIFYVVLCSFIFHFTIGPTGSTGSTGSTGYTGYTGTSGASILPTNNTWTNTNTFNAARSVLDPCSGWGDRLIAATILL